MDHITRVLVIDDNPSSCEYIIARVLMLGIKEDVHRTFDVDRAFTVEQAKSKLTEVNHDASRKFDFIIVDLHMDGNLQAGLKICGFIKDHVRDSYQHEKAPRAAVYSRYKTMPTRTKSDVMTELDKNLKAFQDERVIVAIYDKPLKIGDLLSAVETAPSSELLKTTGIDIRAAVKPIWLWAARLFRDGSPLASMVRAIFLVLSAGSLLVAVPSLKPGTSFVLVGALYLLWFHGLLRGYLYLPRLSREFFEHAMIHPSVCDTYEACVRNIVNTPGAEHDLDYPVEEILGVYETVVKHHLPLRAISFGLHLAALVLLAAVYSSALATANPDVAQYEHLLTPNSIVSLLDHLYRNSIMVFTMGEIGAETIAAKVGVLVVCASVVCLIMLALNVMLSHEIGRVANVRAVLLVGLRASKQARQAVKVLSPG